MKTLNLLPTRPNSFNTELFRFTFKKLNAKLVSSSMMICLVCFAFCFGHNAHAQEYSGSAIFGDSNEYSFDYTIVCSQDGTTALVTADFTAPPPGLVPQIHLGGGSFVGMAGPNPYTYTITGLTGCDFSFQFWMAYAGGLYSSDFLDPSNAPNALPVELISISAAKSGFRTVVLEWLTATEINSDYFDIQRSIDFTSWESVDQVRAKGNSYTNLSYSYTDSDLPLDNRSDVVFYYRLKMIDIDGSYEYSIMTSVQFENYSDKISVYPNPALNYINVDYKEIDSQNEAVQIFLYNELGNQVKVKNVNDRSAESIDVSDLPSGAYFLVVKQGIETIYSTTITKAR